MSYCNNVNGLIVFKPRYKIAYSKSKVYLTKNLKLNSKHSSTKGSLQPTLHQG